MATTYDPNFQNAGGDAFSGLSFTQAEDSPATHDPKYVEQRLLVGGQNEILALIRSRVASATYQQAFSGFSGLSIGTAVYADGPHHVAASSGFSGAATDAALGFLRYKSSDYATSGLLLDHHRYYSAASGFSGAPGSIVYMDAGGAPSYVASTHKVFPYGVSINWNEALLFLGPQVGGGGAGGGGSPGPSGISGFSGTQGVSGFSGISSQSGASGFSGFSAQAGAPGLSGVSGFSGFSGSIGPQGTSGTSGATGFSGASGYSGASGFSSQSGQSGTSGFSGAGRAYSGTATAIARFVDTDTIGDGSLEDDGAGNITCPGGPIKLYGKASLPDTYLEAFWSSDPSHSIMQMIVNGGGNGEFVLGEYSSANKPLWLAGNAAPRIQLGKNGQFTFSGFDSAYGEALRLALIQSVPSVLGLAASEDLATGATISAKATTPATIGSDQNDYNPGATSLFQRWISDATRNVTGLTFDGGQADGQLHVVANCGAHGIVLQDQNSGSASANQILTGTGSDLTLAASGVVILIYDATSTKWRIFAGGSGASGFSGFSGTSGASGYSGKSGASGYSGYTGLSGFSGLNGAGGGDSVPHPIFYAGM